MGLIQHHTVSKHRLPEYLVLRDLVVEFPVSLVSLEELQVKDKCFVILENAFKFEYSLNQLSYVCLVFTFYNCHYKK